MFPDGGDPFFREIQEVYEEIGEGPPPGEGFPRPGELWDQGAEIGASGLFEVVAVRHFDWERVYDAESYIALLRTFSGHIAMEQWQQDRLEGRSGAAWPGPGPFGPPPLGRGPARRAPPRITGRMTKA